MHNEFLNHNLTNQIILFTFSYDVPVNEIVATNDLL